MVCSGRNTNQLKCYEMGTSNSCCILKSRSASLLVTDECVSCTAWDVVGRLSAEQGVLSASSLQPLLAGPVALDTLWGFCKHSTIAPN